MELLPSLVTSLLLLWLQLVATHDTGIANLSTLYNTVAAISSEWWRLEGGVPSGVQGQGPWSGGQRGIAP